MCLDVFITMRAGAGHRETQHKAVEYLPRFLLQVLFCNNTVIFNWLKVLRVANSQGSLYKQHDIL